MGYTTMMMKLTKLTREEKKDLRRKRNWYKENRWFLKRKDRGWLLNFLIWFVTLPLTIWRLLCGIHRIKVAEYVARVAELEKRTEAAAYAALNVTPKQLETATPLAFMIPIFNRRTRCDKPKKQQLIDYIAKCGKFAGKTYRIQFAEEYEYTFFGYAPETILYYQSNISMVRPFCWQEASEYSYNDILTINTTVESESEYRKARKKPGFFNFFRNASAFGLVRGLFRQKENAEKSYSTVTLVTTSNYKLPRGKALAEENIRLEYPNFYHGAKELGAKVLQMRSIIRERKARLHK